jgi:uncharacterized protein (DUF2141 family)
MQLTYSKIKQQIPLKPKRLSDGLIDYLHVTGWSILLFVAFSCAKIGSPLGGPKDETPPKVVKTKPPMNSVNFEPKKKIIITFDEYIQLKDIYQELIVSPPIDGNVMAQVQGKDLVVEFPRQAVFDSVTYTIDFGNAIVDNNEGNVLTAFNYVFSLRNYIDSMNVQGKIVSAFNHQPDEERMYVMLYKNLNDSAPYLEKPSYICRADKLGNFSMQNLETGRYRLFALKDANFNLLYDLPNEQIAFSDSLIELNAERFRDHINVDDTLLLRQIKERDTLSVDSFHVGRFETAGMHELKDTMVIGTSSGVVSDSDSALIDTLQGRMQYSFYTELYFFTQEVRNQYMTNNLRPLKQQLFFSFNEPLTDTFEIFPVNYTPVQPDWFLLDANKTGDTLKFWITDTVMIAMDSLKMEVCYPMYDSSDLVYNKVDTLLMMVSQEKGLRVRRERSRPQKSEPETPKPEIAKVELKNNITKPSAFDLNKRIAIISPTPVSEVLTQRIQLFMLKDTLEIPVKIDVTRDQETYYRTWIQYPAEENTVYKVFIPDSTVIDIYGAVNDTTIFRFKTQAEEYYGAMTITLHGVNEPVLLQLLNEKETILIEKKVASDQSINFDYLYPKNYILKVIVDSNGNGKWDTGNYLKKIQPERVIYYPQQINIRSNWEMDFVWDLNSDN